MSEHANKRVDPAPQAIPVVSFDERRAHDAFEAYAALRLHELQSPELRENPAWEVLVADAFENFSLAFWTV